MYQAHESVSDGAFRAAVAASAKRREEDIEQFKLDWMGEGSSLGDGLCSVIKAVRVEYKMRGEESVGTVDLVAKLRAKEEEGNRLSGWWREMKLFERETEFYNKVLHKLNDILLGLHVCFI